MTWAKTPLKTFTEEEKANPDFNEEEVPEIKEKLWKEAFWSKSYCLITTGGVTIDIIKKYIETQGEK